MPAPAIISRAPHLNILPAIIRTCGLSCNAASSTPRTVTLLMPSDPILGRFMMTTTSLELMGRPSADRATCGMLVTIPAASRSMMLMISLAAAVHTTVTLSSEPVDFSVCCTPLAIIRTAVKTNTTRAMPRTKYTVVRRRDEELRKIYFSGICNQTSPDMPQAFDNPCRQNAAGRNNRSDEAHQQARYTRE